MMVVMMMPVVSVVVVVVTTFHILSCHWYSVSLFLALSVDVLSDGLWVSFSAFSQFCGPDVDLELGLDLLADDSGECSAELLSELDFLLIFHFPKPRSESSRTSRTNSDSNLL